MKTRSIVLALVGVLVIAAIGLAVLLTHLSFKSGVTSTLSSPTTTTPPDITPQIGLNFIRFFWGNNEHPPVAGQPATLDTTTAYVQPSVIFADFSTLGAEAYRQLAKADLTWANIEPTKGTWNFTAADAVLLHSSGAVPIVTLFNYQYASPTPPWETGKAETVFGDDAKAYLQAVIDRYGKVVKYWEIGNEMDHWRAKSDQFTPEQQGAFFKDASDYIRAHDSDAVILMPGMSGISDYILNTWFAGFLSTAGASSFDIINYHEYGPWMAMTPHRKTLQTFMDAHGLSSKPVWLTETGSTFDASSTHFTNYPNSPLSQGADVFRRLTTAYGQGDSFVAWHTYISSSGTSDTTWNGFGLRSSTDSAEPSYTSFELFTKELIPFKWVSELSDTGQFVYQFQLMDGTFAYVAWGSGPLTMPNWATKTISAVSRDGTFIWKQVAPGSTVTLSDVPILIK